MKRLLAAASLILAAVGVLVFLGRSPTLSGTPRASPRADRLSDAPPSEPTRAATAHPLQDLREDLLGQVQMIASEYAALVEREELEGRLRRSTPPAGEQAPFQLLDSSDSPLYLAWDNSIGEIQLLNEEYAAHFGAESDPPDYPVPDPRPTGEYEVQALIDAAANDYISWLEEEQRTGSFVVLFDPYELQDQAILIGDSYVREQQRWAALMRLRLELLAPSQQDREADAAAIGRVLPGEVRLEDVGRLMPMYTDHLLCQYRVGEWRVLMDAASHQILLIDKEEQTGAHHEPQTASAQPGTLTPDALEQRAADFVELAAPGTDLASLAPVHGQKDGNHFFRWEDRTGPLLPDGRSYPFVQVALTAAGDLLNYYNTL